MSGMADCGAHFAHEPHVYRTVRGKAKACDGSTEKRSSQPGYARIDPAGCGCTDCITGYSRPAREGEDGW